jgi:hypothetical protein
MPIRGSPNGPPNAYPRSPQPDAIIRYGWTSSIGIAGRHHSARPTELVARRPDVLFGFSTPSIRALTPATATIPIVMFTSDPLREGS